MNRGAWRSVLLMLPPAMWAQSIVPPDRIAAERAAFEEAGVRSLHPAIGGLRCDIREVRPVLSFSFRFEAGYTASIPLAQFDAAGHTITTHLRVTSAGRDPVYLTKIEELRYAPDTPESSLQAELGGRFVIGEGSYRVELLAEDEEHRACRGSWQLQARRTAAERNLTLPTPPGAVEDLSARALTPAPVPGPRISRLTIFVHAAPLSPNASRLQPADEERLIDSLASLLSQMPATRVGVAAFNLDQRAVIYRNGTFDADSLGDLAAALHKLQLALVDYRTLTRPERPIDVLIELLRGELHSPAPPDAIIVLGPRTRVLGEVPASAIERRPPSIPVFYVQFDPGAQFLRMQPGRGMGMGGGGGRVGARGFPYPAADDPMIAAAPRGIDIIDRLMSQLKADTIAVSNPDGFAAAIHRMDSRIAHNGTALAAELPAGSPPPATPGASRSAPSAGGLMEPTGPEDPRDVLLSLRDQVLKHGERIPNHICVESIQRERYAPIAGYAEQACGPLLARRKEPNAALRMTLDHTDWLRLDVGLSPEREIYSWAGAREFVEGDIDELVPEGAIGTGPFASMLLNAFAVNGPRFTFDGETVESGRRIYQYSFIVPQERSRYRVKALRDWVITGYSGTVLVDPETSELVRLRVRTDELPAVTGSCETDTDLEYAPVKLGENDYLLPKTARQRFIGRDGGEAANDIAFSACREYQAESMLTFGGKPAGGTRGGGPGALEIPAGRPVSIELLTAVRLGISAAGDRIEGRMMSEITDEAGKVVIPLDAAVRGRLMRVEMRTAPRAELTVALRWEEVEVNGAPVPLHLTPNRTVPDPRAAPGALRRRAIEIELPLAGESRYAVLHFYGPQPSAPAGLRTEWTTVHEVGHAPAH